MDRPGGITYEPVCLKEYELFRIVLDVNQWNFLEYYVRQTLEYCRKSKILNNEEIQKLKISRVQNYKKTSEGKRSWVKFQSFAKNLNDSIMVESSIHKLAIEYFQHSDYNFSSETLSRNQSKPTNSDVSRQFFNGNYLSDDLLTLRKKNLSTRVKSIVFQNTQNELNLGPCREFPYEMSKISPKLNYAHATDNLENIIIPHQLMI